MKRVKTLFCLYVLFLPVCLTAQDVTNFTQFFINPYSFNPSYAGVEGRNAFFLAYRKQWATIDGGPTIANLTFHTPLKGGLNFGLNIVNDTRGILSNSGMMLTLGYTVRLEDHKYIRFGLSAGGAWNGVNVDEIMDTNDPALTNLLDNNFSLLGNAGLSVHLNSFHFGASIPNIFAPSYVSPDAFTITEVKPFQSLVLHASNRFYFGGDKHIFEPYILYRMHQGPRDEEKLPSQLEVAGVVHLNHVVWVGGSYKQDFGISALGGIKNNFFLIGLSYSLGNTGINELNSPTYEVQLSYIFGPKPKRNPPPIYSFVNSAKEKAKKPPGKTPAQLAVEKHQQEEVAKQEALAKQKAEEEMAALEAQQLAAQEAQQQAEQETQRQAEREVQQQEEREAQQQVERETQERLQQEALVVEQQKQPTQQAALVRPTPVPSSTFIEVPYVKSAFGVHDGGPRFTNRPLLPVVLDDNYEAEQLSQLNKLGVNPVEQHNTDPNINPNAQRHEFVKRGSHPEELNVGNYVINGAFSSKENADRFSKELLKLGFNARYGHLTKKNLWYVYVAQSTDINQAKLDREKYRNLKLFKDAWLLTVEN